jgi:hypothetical protein
VAADFIHVVQKLRTNAIKRHQVLSMMLRATSHSYLRRFH